MGIKGDLRDSSVSACALRRGRRMPMRFWQLCLGVVCITVALAITADGLIADETDTEFKTASAPNVRIVDGDTIVIDEQRFRLHGIDAPESGQTCTIDGRSWPCGREATAALVKASSRGPLRCDGREWDRYGRIVAVCYSGGNDLNAWMVREGWALAYRRYSKDYVKEEADAATAQRGMWSGSFSEPWTWRREQRTAKR